LAGGLAAGGASIVRARPARAATKIRVVTNWFAEPEHGRVRGKGQRISEAARGPLDGTFLPGLLLKTYRLLRQNLVRRGGEGTRTHK